MLNTEIAAGLSDAKERGYSCVSFFYPAAFDFNAFRGMVFISRMGRQWDPKPRARCFLPDVAHHVLGVELSLHDHWFSKEGRRAEFRAADVTFLADGIDELIEGFLVHTLTGAALLGIMLTVPRTTKDRNLVVSWSYRPAIHAL